MRLMLAHRLEQCWRSGGTVVRAFVFYHLGSIPVSMSVEFVGSLLFSERFSPLTINQFNFGLICCDLQFLVF